MNDPSPGQIVAAFIIGIDLGLLVILLLIEFFDFFKVDE